VESRSSLPHQEIGLKPPSSEVNNLVISMLW
jgi:hypothetical protein